ncbi:hypothetical protein GCM10018966_011310 [Streptomyces yanii]
MFTVGPGDISEYGTFISTPAQSSAMRISVEASIVAVRRGMERQYGKGLSVHRRGRSVRGGGSGAVLSPIGGAAGAAMRIGDCVHTVLPQAASEPE